jgi:asparagine synthase (glutamine-hydrolysing)
MFAFAFYDSESRRLLVSRDFFGIKPLYWCRWEGGLALASEAEVLLQLPGVSAVSDPQATYDFLVFGASDHARQSIYRDLYHFPAAHFAEIRLDTVPELEPRRYWNIDLSRKIHPEFQVAAEEVRRLFLESVDLHLRSDVPVGTALSGGIDSSAIVCAIRYLNPEQEIHTISYIADDDAINEEKWIDIVNRHANCVSHKVRARQADLAADLEDLIHAQGEPFGSTSIYAQYRIFREAQRHDIKVMLDGQGADEILAGYIVYQGSRLASLIVRGRWIRAWQFLRSSGRWPGRSKKRILMLAVNELLPEWLRWWARGLVSKAVPPKWIAPAWLISRAVNPRSNLARGISGGEKMRKRLLENLTNSSIPHLLRYEDRNSMRFSIESRVPFLHVDLVEYLYSLPEEYLLSPDGVSKCIFREAMRGIVPDEILDRHDKIGFATPERNWLAALDSWVDDNFRYGEKLEYFNMAEVKKEWQAIISGRKEFNFKCWRWLNLIAWEKAK